MSMINFYLIIFNIFKLMLRWISVPTREDKMKNECVRSSIDVAFIVDERK